MKIKGQFSSSRRSLLNHTICAYSVISLPKQITNVWLPSGIGQFIITKKTMKSKQITYQQFNDRRTFLKAATVLGAAALSPVPLFGNAPATSKTESQADGRLVLGMVVFDGFQLLDVFGPLDVFGSLRDKVSIIIVGEKGESVKSSAGPILKLDYTFSNVPKIDVLMIPGGGTRREVKNEAFL